MRLDDPNISYLIISAFKEKEDLIQNKINMSKLQDSLIFNDFAVIEMGSNKQPSYLAYKSCSNDELRYDALELMDRFNQEFVIVKYLGEDLAKKIIFDGREELMGIVNYDGIDSDHSFYVEGLSISFRPQKRYWNPSKSSDFKKDMIVEYKNNNNEWVEKMVKDPDVEYERMYKILIKYNKIRIPFE